MASLSCYLVYSENRDNNSYLIKGMVHGDSPHKVPQSIVAMFIRWRVGRPERLFGQTSSIQKVAKSSKREVDTPK